jgi:hypothetical protein
MRTNKKFPKKHVLSPKINSKDSHTNLPRSRSHNRPTNPRNKSKQVAKQKHNSKSEGLRQICLARMDRPYGRLGLSVATGGPSVKRGYRQYLANKTSRNTSMNMDRPISIHRLSVPNGSSVT